MSESIVAKTCDACGLNIVAGGNELCSQCAPYYCLNAYTTHRVTEKDTLCMECKRYNEEADGDKKVQECPYCDLWHKAFLPCPIVTVQERL